MQKTAFWKRSPCIRDCTNTRNTVEYIPGQQLARDTPSRMAFDCNVSEHAVFKRLHFYRWHGDGDGTHFQECCSRVAGQPLKQCCVNRVWDSLFCKTSTSLHFHDFGAEIFNEQSRSLTRWFHSSLDQKGCWWFWQEERKRRDKRDNNKMNNWRFWRSPSAQSCLHLPLFSYISSPIHHHAISAKLYHCIILSHRYHKPPFIHLCLSIIATALSLPICSSISMPLRLS